MHEENEQVTCPECGLAFASLKGMRQHKAAKHKIKVAKTQVFQPEIHSLAGLPQCSGCQHKFQTWCALKKHVEQGSCRTPVFAASSEAKANPEVNHAETCNQVATTGESGALQHVEAVQTLIQERG